MTTESLEPASALQLMERAKKMGAKFRFNFSDGAMLCAETGARYSADRLSIMSINRFEGASDPDDSEIIYLLSADDGTVGIFIDAFGALGNPQAAEFCTQLTRR